MIEVAQSKLRENLARVLKAAKGGNPVMVKRRGKVEVVILPVADWDLLQALESKLDVEYAKAARAEIAAGRSMTIPWEDVEAELGL